MRSVARRSVSGVLAPRRLAAWQHRFDVRIAADGDDRIRAGQRRVGHGFATEALAAMVDLARSTGVHRLYALCHAVHRASAHVLEKCGFLLEETRHSYA